jgi:hypothetical protein
VNRRPNVPFPARRSCISAVASSRLVVAESATLDSDPLAGFDRT